MGRLALRLAAIVALAGLALGQAAVVGAATWADFGRPTATSSFEVGIRFEQPVTIDRALARVELLLTVADQIGPLVIPLPSPGTGVTILRHVLGPADGGQFLPNTPMVARWRLVAADDPNAVETGPEVRVTFADDRFTWQSAAGQVVRVHWYEGTTAFGARALRIAEDAVREVSDLLMVTESEPVDFFVYADQDAFYDALGPGTRENVGGLAAAHIRTLFALISPGQIDDAWVGIVIPHELAHLVFDTASDNPYHSPPHWLNEGLADYLSQGYDASYRRQVTEAARAGELIPLDGLTGQFPTGAERFVQAYAESTSAVDYLVRIHGRAALVTLIRSYAQGRTDDEAFNAAIGLDMAAFGSAWLDDLGATAPTRYGPQPAPDGPIPSAWLGEAAATTAPTASSGPAAASAGASAGPTPAAPAADGGAAGWAVVALAAALSVGGLALAWIARRRRNRGSAQ